MTRQDQTSAAMGLPTGVWPVMLTPFRDDGSIDWRALDELVEWYLQARVSGLFANVQSAEVSFLTEDERIAVAQAVLRRVNGRVPVISSGFASGPIERQAEFFKRVSDTGVEAVILTTAQLSPELPSDDEWRERAERLLALTQGIALGLYEIPKPYWFRLSPSLMNWAGTTGRFHFHKDTSCQSEIIRAKLTAIRGTPLRFYNADTPTLLDSLLAGAHGFSGIGANYLPELFVWLCGHFADEPEQAGRVHGFLEQVNEAMHQGYPASAKMFLRLRGLNLTPACRSMDVSATTIDTQWLTRLLSSFRQMMDERGPS